MSPGGTINLLWKFPQHWMKQSWQKSRNFVEHVIITTIQTGLVMDRVTLPWQMVILFIY